MELYVDSSALVKRYVAEPDSEPYMRAMEKASRLVTARHTLIETGRAIARESEPLRRQAALEALNADWLMLGIAELDMPTCALALEIAIDTQLRTLDALHLAAAWRTGGHEMQLLSADQRQCDAAIALGIEVYSPLA